MEERFMAQALTESTCSEAAACRRLRAPAQTASVLSTFCSSLTRSAVLVVSTVDAGTGGAGVRETIARSIFASTSISWLVTAGSMVGALVDAGAAAGGALLTVSSSDAALDT